MVTTCLSQVKDITLHDAAERGKVKVVQNSLNQELMHVDAVDEVNKAL